MTEKTGKNGAESRSFASEQARWQALTRRDRRADGVFVYGVTTTGVYCRPWCPSRLPKRSNVRFFATNEIFRRPTEDPLSSRLSSFMTRNVISIPPRTDLGEAAQLMKEKNVGCLPVVDGGLLGIVTERDMLKTF